MKNGKKITARAILYTVGGLMLAAAVVFFIFALTHPEFGSVIMLGNIRIGSGVWKIFYCCYLLITAGVFAASFFVKK